MSITRSLGQSQLDYLWDNYGDYKVATEPSSTASDEVILTESALSLLVSEATGGAIVTLKYKEHPTKENTLRLIGYDSYGIEVTSVEMPEEIHVIAFTSRDVTLEDIDAGSELELGTSCLALTLSDGTGYLVSLESLSSNVDITGGETNTINTKVTSGVINSHLKIDSGNNTLSVVLLKSNEDGIYANLKLSSESEGATLSKEEDGLKIVIPLGTTSYNIKFELLTLSEYLSLETKDEGTIYFLTDTPYIYLGSYRYGINLSEGQYPISDVIYDSGAATITVCHSDGSSDTVYSIGLATSTLNGLMSADTYNELVALINILGDITDVEEYVAELVLQAAFKLSIGKVSGTTKPLNLVNGNGDILSTVDLDAENYLGAAVNREATSDDVEAAEEAGVAIEEGDQILILTLTSGDVIYVNLSTLVDVYTGVSTDAITLTISNNKITADLNISADDQMLYVYDDGLRSHFQVVRSEGTLTFYGKTTTDDDKLAEIALADTCTLYIFVESATIDTVGTYPPRYVDMVAYDIYSNPVVEGEPYFILVYESDTGVSATSYEYCDYISLGPILNSIILSPEEGNTLTKDDNGYLYNSINWIEVE